MWQLLAQVAGEEALPSWVGVGSVTGVVGFLLAWVITKGMPNKDTAHAAQLRAKDDAIAAERATADERHAKLTEKVLEVLGSVSTLMGKATVVIENCTEVIENLKKDQK